MPTWLTILAIVAGVLALTLFLYREPVAEWAKAAAAWLLERFVSLFPRK